MCCGGWAVFSVVLWCFFLLLMALALLSLVFSTFVEVIWDCCQYHGRARTS
jgi:hypothetical protein